MRMKSRSQTNNPSETTNVVASRTDRDNSGFGIRRIAWVSPRKMVLSSKLAVDWLMESPAAERDLGDTSVPGLTAPVGCFPRVISVARPGQEHHRPVGPDNRRRRSLEQSARRFRSGP